ncbi:bifunctional diaminohydroxyphosphoribosylaminopyrimidine deaminase/5-amino-6-(5-phosphoribosylamino)uracil reductase RibD [Saccharospirillum impatiens]|uniref:bifunctional diaminohydroxyphosphoribosylaminopyrimidine deaminase/5-amino-6-(5-phosphoribosylamino)uracil reductase RibD n=1 Tax=Saccharospirillum impatiens TaxID=169438 RepID=UPI001B7F90D5|nr:bifunctional diaminohydroxyphosphoribosylaminopyrimidine deaminase/5-amino-6-(5-phosphoribosylamino)uracil reductase RibD [Saccharospirillum impatiens]
MRQALNEGRKARGICGDNPPVGCVLVSNGLIVSRGHTGRPGEHHAEAMALANLQEGLNDISAYVTLEPCSFQGRTPSCAKALVESGIKSVFVGIIDPDPRNNGAGIQLLEAAGVAVTVGLLAADVEHDLGPYLLLNK